MTTHKQVRSTEEALTLALALEALERIATVNAMDYEYQRWAKEYLAIVKQALAQPDQEKQFAKVFAQMKSENEPCSEVLALGQMMKEWLQHQVSDNGSCVDTGKGFSEYDLWVMCEGKELFITIKEKRPTK